MKKHFFTFNYPSGNAFYIALVFLFINSIFLRVDLISSWRGKIAFLVVFIASYVPFFSLENQHNALKEEKKIQYQNYREEINLSSRQYFELCNFVIKRVSEDDQNEIVDLVTKHTDEMNELKELLK
ncbi:hypothetical protein [Enterocloster lavalensis]|uniref:hypothetical protein n=1 Tax=Enterocloster lavalensis TaxID=460384 RepID=UPI000D1B2BD0|nr:hypothetical protein [Enterocloster lavalensis]PST33968.1 hypothetical protein C7256_06010 [Enterocloster lavalensis]